MAERRITDATGDRWDVREESGATDGEFRLNFRHQSGRTLDVDSDQGVNALSDRELLDMLADRAGDRELRIGEEQSADPDGYITE